MLKEVIEDAIARGERLKKDIVGQILKSATINELLNNRKFAETIARVIQTKDEIARSIHRNVQEALKTMSIPSKTQISSYERRIDMLEKKIDTMGRNLMKKKLNGGRGPRKSNRRSGR
jgi:polyhydroxyalkanoate synthesis regulator phasin